MSKLVYCPKCDNVTHLKEKCKFCGKRGVMMKGSNGYFKLKKKKK